ncbi:hypothetical protein [Aurantiacibacter gangjinensis]|nr:hypothetical protein [Aurantiacibacter gangjinensis]APE28352.1 hypothetical protein BMF35_a1523 [Aurantiacibacter gangjinensis]
MGEWRARLPSVLALAIPVVAGALWMALSGAPSHYAWVNLAALALASLWALTGRGPHTALSRHMLVFFLVVFMLTPLVVGPELTSITGDRVVRWFPVGGLAIHTGMVAVPALVVLAARNRRQGFAFLLAGLGAALFQPDAATGFAITFAAIGIHHVTRDWKMGMVAILGFFASIAMALSGEIPPQPFVERVLIDAAGQSIVIAIALAAGLLATFALILAAVPLNREKRFALGGALFGFFIMAMMSHYPMPLIGYGAAPIIGFGLALGLHRIPKR